MTVVTRAQPAEIVDTATLLARARALVPALAERAQRTASERRVPDETIAEFQRADFFRVLQPKRFGGLELDFRTFALLVRELAHGCGSSAWVYAVIGELGWVMAMFPEAAQREVWGDNPRALGCAAIDPAGRAEVAAGGFRLTGQWRFVSGSDHADWVMVTAPCGDNVVRHFLVHRSEMQFIDDWHVLGLAGTGSKSVKTDKVFVPEHRTITQDDLLNATTAGRYLHSDGQTYRAPRRFLTPFSISPVLVGLAERALELVLDNLRKPIASGAAPADLDALRLRVAESTAEIETAGLILETTLSDCMTRLGSPEPITAEEIWKKRFTGAYMLRLARQAIDRLCMVSGSGWVFEGHPLQLIFRDAITGSTHRAMSFEAHAQSYMRVLGLDAK
jgi:3-hydroxy-9,10-secoandrosta-1,3,5(10)-triene-9,17-dione monooxygenase